MMKRLVLGLVLGLTFTASAEARPIVVCKQGEEATPAHCRGDRLKSFRRDSLRFARAAEAATFNTERVSYVFCYPSPVRRRTRRWQCSADFASGFESAWGYVRRRDGRPVIFPRGTT